MKLSVFLIALVFGLPAFAESPKVEVICEQAYNRNSPDRALRKAQEDLNEKIARLMSQGHYSFSAPSIDSAKTATGHHATVCVTATELN